MLIIPFVLDTIEGFYTYLKKVYDLRPFSFELDEEDIKNERKFFVQDADCGQSNGQFKYTYEGPYYKRYINKIKKAGLGLMMTTDRPALKLLNDLENSGLYHNNRLIIGNGGACVYEYDKQRKKYVLTHDKKISSDAVKELKRLFGDQSMGALIFNTKRHEYTYFKSHSPFERLRTIYRLKNRSILNANSFSGLESEVRNISFNIFPQYKFKFFSVQTDVKSKFWSRISKTRLGIGVSKNLPQLRELFLRRKSTYTDKINQFDVARQVLQKLICYDADGADPAYINELSVTFSTKGLELVPTNCSRMGSLPEWQERNKKSDNANLRDFVVSGDNYNNFFAPVPLSELRQTYKRFLITMQDDGEFLFDLLEEFLKLSKPAQGFGYDDLAKVALRYKVKDNSLSSYFLAEKFKEVAKAANEEMQENKNVEARIEKLNEINDDLNNQISTLKDKFIHNQITEEKYEEQKNELTKQQSLVKLKIAIISGREDQREEYENRKAEYESEITARESEGCEGENAPQEAPDEGRTLLNKLNEVDGIVAKPITDELKYQDPAHSAENPHALAKYVQIESTR